MPFNSMQNIHLEKPVAFSSLVYLDLSWNYLTDSCLDKLGKLYSIEVLNLSGNRFVNFPVQDDSLPNIIELRLSSNRLKKEAISNLVKLESLESLHLDQNKIK